MTFRNFNKSLGVEKMITAKYDNSREDGNSVHNKYSNNARLFEAIGTQKNTHLELPSYPNAETPQSNLNIYRFEMVGESSGSKETSTGPVLSFWTQPKQFEWNFE
eukprot:GFUD01112778.1.p1 GENE.GFUD01112778.1~~GFUD01112778.1.p1  ORF type:complete len:105 (+),score=22.29 GFUD01112778.1:20-334(+)